MTDWLTCYHERAKAEMRLFCFPYAGASGSVFRTWQDDLPEWLEVCPIEPPGRWGRMHEPLMVELDTFVAATVDGIAGYLDKPFALFGHSLGGLAAFEVARRLRRTDREPLALIVAARRAPQLTPPTVLPPISHLPNAEFAEALAAHYGGLSEAVLSEPELLDIVLRITRADMAMLENYRYRDDAPLSFPILAMGGRHDKMTPEADLPSWGVQTSGECDVRLFEGGHFFIVEEQSKVLAAVAENLQPKR